MKLIKLFFCILILLVLSVGVSAECGVDDFCPDGTSGEIFDPYDPSNAMNYNSADFYDTVPVDQWDWTLVNYDVVDLSRSDIYDSAGFYDNLPTHKYKEIDYNKVDYGQVDQSKIDSGKFFKDKQCANCQLNKGTFKAGKDFEFTATGLKHKNGKSWVTLDGGNYNGASFRITKNEVIADYTEALKNLNQPQSVQTNDPVTFFVDHDAMDNKDGLMALTVNGVSVWNGRVDVDNQGRVFTRAGEEVIIDNVFLKGERVQLIPPGQNPPKTGSYFRASNNRDNSGYIINQKIKARSKDLEINTLNVERGNINVWLGKASKYGKGTGEIDADWDQGILSLNGYFHEEEDTDKPSPFLGNGGTCKGIFSNSGLSLTRQTKYGEKRGAIVAKNRVIVYIAGNSNNQNPYLDEGGGAMRFYAGDIKGQVINYEHRRTKVSFYPSKKKIAGMSVQEKERYYFKNAKFTTWGASDCEVSGICNLKAYTNRDFTLTIMNSNFGQGGDGKSIGSFDHLPGIQNNAEGIPKLLKSGDDLDYEASPYIFSIREEDEQDKKKRSWGRGKGQYFFDGQQGQVIPLGESKKKLLLGLTPEKVKEVKKELSELFLDGTKASDKFSHLITDFHKKQFQNEYNGVDVTCNEKKCGPGNGLGSYYWWRMKEELDALKEYSGLTSDEMFKSINTIEFSDYSFDPDFPAKANYNNKEIIYVKQIGGWQTTLFGHETLHFVEKNNYKKGGSNQLTDYAKIQNADLDGTEWMLTGSPVIEEDQGRKSISLYKQVRKNPYENLFSSHFFTTLCRSEGCFPVEYTTMGQDLFSGDPDKARELLDPSSVKYQKLVSQAVKKLADPNIDEEEKTFYTDMSIALSGINPEKKHPANLARDALGNQLLGAKTMSPSYCAANFAGHCGKAVDGHMATVEKLYKAGEISQQTYLERKAKADELIKFFGKK